MSEEKVEGAISIEARKRPTGLTIIAILWFLGGIYNLYMSSQVISDDLEVLPHLSDPWVAEWFKFGVPAELAISLLVFALGLIQLFTIIGLWTGKSWSYKLALAIPVLAVVSWISMAALYMSAPIELEIRESINWFAVLFSIFWMIIYWSYLRQPHVKEYLGVISIRRPICPQCGRVLPPDLKFCPYCGKALTFEGVKAEKNIKME